MNAKRWILTGAVVLSGLVAPVARADDPEEEAIRTVERLGGNAYRDDNQVGRPVVTVQFPNNPITDKDLEVLARFRHLQGAHIGSPTLTDAGLKVLEGFPDLQWLDLRNSQQLTEKGLKHLVGLAKLQYLDLGFPVTDAGLKELAGLTQMQELEVGGGPQLTDAGLKHLVGMKKLRILSLAATGVTDAGLKELTGMSELRSPLAQ